MKTLETRDVELETENARLQRLVAELIARNQQLRQALDSAIARKQDSCYSAQQHDTRSL